jgi:transcriptional regulator with XRE-family HTH domain
VKHTPARKPVPLIVARGRVAGLTQLKLEELSGVDRTRISKLEIRDDTDVNHSTYEKLDAALRSIGALKANEKLVFGPVETAAAS